MDVSLESIPRKVLLYEMCLLYSPSKGDISRTMKRASIPRAKKSKDPSQEEQAVLGCERVE
jgi:hypothetical protein